MGVERHFLGWEAPGLSRAVEWLWQQGPADRDYSQWRVVVPGRRAGRRLLQLLAAQAETEQIPLAPPRIVTVGALPEELYRPAWRLASHLGERLAWAAALADEADRAARDLFGEGSVELLASWRRRLALAEDLARLADSLLGEGYSFAEIAEWLAHRAGGSEVGRWRSLARLYERYDGWLAEAGCADRATSRRAALAAGRWIVDGPVVLIGTLDLPRLTRQLLAACGAPVHALIHAPEEEAAGYDEFGALRPEVWERRRIDLPDASVRIVDRPIDQAFAVLDALAALAGRYAPDEVLVAFGEEALAPTVARTLRAAGLRPHSAIGTPLHRSRPGQLLVALATWLESEGVDAFAALVRHPDLERWWSADPALAGYLDALDRYREERVPARLGEPWPEEGVPAPLPSLWEVVARWCQPLAGGARPLSQWRAAIGNVLAPVYADLPEMEPRLMESLAAVAETLDEIAALPEALSPVTSAAEALAIVVDALSERVLPAEPEEPAIEMVGWLETALDDAPVLIVAGMNEGAIPESVDADLFLPDGVRRELGLFDNRRRYARDAALLVAALHSRERLVLIAGRRSAENDPLVPSRLLFAGDVAATVRRIRAFAEVEPSPRRRPVRPAPATAFRVPPPLACTPPRRLAVTAFRDYLACPYTFYLKHVLRLAEPDDAAIELHEAGFGSLGHRVLAEFGRSDLRDSTDPTAIAKFLHQELTDLVRRNYGAECPPIVALQIAELRRRLERFARVQAAEAQSGWRIDPALVEAQAKAWLLPPNSPEGGLEIVGRIDRVDRHRDGHVRILDYKTGTPIKPDAAHRQGRGTEHVWVDLQLPLYRLLGESLGLPAEAELGYYQLPAQLERTGVELADWGEATVAEGIAKAQEVARRILRCEFWPPTRPKEARAFAGVLLARCVGWERLVAAGEEAR